MILMCFDVILMCFEVCRVMCFRMFSLDFVTFEVFHPVWALYNIKREAGHMSEPPPQASCAGQVFGLSWHPALYRVPVCQTGAGWRVRRCEVLWIKNRNSSHTHIRRHSQMAVLRKPLLVK